MLNFILNIIKAFIDVPVKNIDEIPEEPIENKKVSEVIEKEVVDVEKNNHSFYKIPNVACFTQTDNKLFRLTSCYATSMAMLMNFCLQSEGLTKSDVGCPAYMQLEDYISRIIESKSTKDWIRRNIRKYGSWMLHFKPRTIAYVQEYVFNSLMKEIGYKASFTTTLTYTAYCNHIESTGLPIALNGIFTSVSRVGGHIVAGVGFNKEKEAVIVNDPYGNAIFDSYKTHKHGNYAEYPIRFFTAKSKNKKYMWGMLINKI